MCLYISLGVGFFFFVLFSFLFCARIVLYEYVLYLRSFFFSLYTSRWLSSSPICFKKFIFLALLSVFGLKFHICAHFFLCFVTLLFSLHTHNSLNKYNAHTHTHTCICIEIREKDLKEAIDETLTSVLLKPMRHTLTEI